MQMGENNSTRRSMHVFRALNNVLQLRKHLIELTPAPLTLLCVCVSVCKEHLTECFIRKILIYILNVT